MQQYYLTTQQAAEELQVQRQTIRKHIKAGKLQATMIGRDYLIRLEDLQAFKGTKRGYEKHGMRRKPAETDQRELTS